MKSYRNKTVEELVNEKIEALKDTDITYQNHSSIKHLSQISIHEDSLGRLLFSFLYKGKNKDKNVHLKIFNNKNYIIFSICHKEYDNPPFLKNGLYSYHQTGSSIKKKGKVTSIFNKEFEGAEFFSISSNAQISRLRIPLSLICDSLTLAA